jgi:murein L,D-transpeptidase YafK
VRGGVAMIFESKYRRQAMELWEQSKEETKLELLGEIHNHHTNILSFAQWMKAKFSAVLGHKKQLS